jgi:DNA modification methylase
MLGAELFDLKGLGFDLGSTAFDEDELSELLTPKGLIGDEDAVPDAPANPVTVTGDVFRLGTHRLMCGDSTKAADVGYLLENAKPMLMVTDPPYGVEYDPAWRDGVSGALGTAARKQRGKVQNDDRPDWREAWVLFPGDVAYVWHGGLHAAVVAGDLSAAGFNLRAQIIWVKQQGVFSRGDYHWQHEPCWYAVKESGKGHWAGDRKQTTVWEIQSLCPTGNRKEDRVGHGTQKPVECMRRPVLNNSKPGDAVYDPFCGSGTTLIACESEGRRCYALEIDPVYCDVIVARWETATGKKAVLQATGQTLDQLREERMGVVA